MPGRYTKAEREKLADKALSLSARGMSLRAISAVLGPTKDTIGSWLADELAKRSEHRGQDKEKAIAVYVEVQRAAWERFENTDFRSLNSSGYLNTIKSCQERIDKITGAEAPFKHQDVTDTYEIVFDEEESFGIAAD